MAIDSLEPIPAGGTTQWIRVRGADAANPVLLLIQQGPGLPMINEARRFDHLLSLEQAFTVIYWDQRGCGRSLRRMKDRDSISVERMAGDTVSLLDFLRDRFGGKTYVAGFSFGATLGAHAAAQRPDLVAALVAVGMDVDGAAAANAAYDFALAAARQRGNRRATRQLEAIGPPPHLNAKQFAIRVRWATNFGGGAQRTGDLLPNWPASGSPRPSTPGVFAAGDVRHGSVKRVASAVGDGSIAIRLAHDYLA